MEPVVHKRFLQHKVNLHGHEWSQPQCHIGLCDMVCYHVVSLHLSNLPLEGAAQQVRDKELSTTTILVRNPSFQQSLGAPLPKNFPWKTWVFCRENSSFTGHQFTVRSCNWWFWAHFANIWSNWKIFHQPRFPLKFPGFPTSPSQNATFWGAFTTPWKLGRPSKIKSRYEWRTALASYPTYPRRSSLAPALLGGSSQAS